MSNDLLPIPSADTATDPIHSPADLRQRWRALMGPLGFGERLLRFAFVGPDRCLLKVLSDMPIGPNPAPDTVDNLMAALSAVVSDLGEGSSVALLLTRPGVDGISKNDRRWASMLESAAERFDVAIEPILRANDDAIVLLGRKAQAA